MDFTSRKYEILLKTLLRQGFYFQTFEEFYNNPAKRSVILRHDVDKRPEYALRLASIEFDLGIKASYHFRIVPESNDPEYISEVVKMGHEIAYHYEDLNLVSSMKKIRNRLKSDSGLSGHDKDHEFAYMSFKTNLDYFRKYYPVKVISMHGSPKSKIDNRELWKLYNYKDSGILCEPYFDIDYSKVLYLTDTGRRWNGEKVNVRDKISTGFGSTRNTPLSKFVNYSSTDDIINAVEKDNFSKQVIINTHPQRWTDNYLWWFTEYLLQNVKNIVKYLIVEQESRKIKR